MLVTPPAIWPVTLADAKLHLRVEHDAEDALITSLIYAATHDAEGEMQRAIHPQTWRRRLDAWPDVIRLWPARVTGITSVAYVDTDGVTVTLPSDRYQLSADDLGARLVPAWGASWPEARQQLDTITVTYSCGTWPAAADVPASVTAWIKLRLTDLYEQRGTVTTSAASPVLPYAAGLLDPWRVRTL
jgi:uncharacterized phiE125 gp8 family phage protein